MPSNPHALSNVEPRFALLYHAMEATAGRHDHWDLMLEHGGGLVTFELLRLPTGKELFEARRLADHRLAYLEYEGHISGNRGNVVRLDRGRYRELRSLEVADCERPFQVALHGQRLEAVIGCDQPLALLPLGRAVQLQALRWDWHS
jgi:hypothetical protein